MTYFQGIDTPDTEPRRNRYAEAKRKSKFTEDVAKTVVDGDVYLSLRSPAHQRFYVPVEVGEHGVSEDGLLCVTHQFRQPFPDIKGRWHPYDGGGNLVIKVRGTDDDSIAYEALNAIESALYQTPLGRAIGHDAVRPLAKSLMKTFGIERDDSFRSTFTVDVAGEKQARDALRDLLNFAPESGYNELLGTIGAEADGVGFAENREQYAYLINGKSDGFGGKARTYGEVLPFLSQPVFYAVLGYKGNGRSFQSLLDALMEAVGLTEDDLR
jgi:hypothetical protein